MKVLSLAMLLFICTMYTINGQIEIKSLINEEIKEKIEDEEQTPREKPDKPAIKVKASSLMSKEAKNKKVTEDFGYLILGNNSPQQGVSASVNDEKSSLKISGILHTGKFATYTMEADLTTSDGIYFLNNNSNGSNQGRITLNGYKVFKYNYSQYVPKAIDELNYQLEIINLLMKTKTEYDTLKKMVYEEIDRNIIDSDAEDKALGVLKELFNKYIPVGSKNSYDILSVRKLKDSCYCGISEDESFIFTELKSKEYSKNNKSYMKPVKVDNSDINSYKVLSDYLRVRDFILNKLKDKIVQFELSKVNPNIAAAHITFAGVSVFYERESLERFKHESEIDFSNMIKQEKGDLFGISGSFSYSMIKGKGSKRKIKPEQIFIRASTLLSRVSNNDNFQNSTLQLTAPIGLDKNNNPIETITSKSAYNGNLLYEYGSNVEFNFEAYYFPIKTLGVFGTIGYHHREYSISPDKELTPLRVGILFSLLNEDKDKSKVTIQTFVDNKDIATSEGEKNDFMFGIGVGFPISFN